MANVSFPRSKIIDDNGIMPPEWVAYLQSFGTPAYLLQVPITGFSIAIPNPTTTLILDPIGTLSNGNITLPAAPTDGQVVRITCTQTITTLAVTTAAGQTLKNAPTTFATSLVNDMGYSFIFVLSNATWYRIQ